MLHEQQKFAQYLKTIYTKFTHFTLILLFFSGWLVGWLVKLQFGGLGEGHSDTVIHFQPTQPYTHAIEVQYVFRGESHLREGDFLFVLVQFLVIGQCNRSE